MKKITALVFTIVLCISSVVAIEPNITMTTSKILGSTITLKLAARTDNTIIQVDFGDGLLVENTISSSLTKISGTLVGSQFIKIYGANIDSLYCRYNQLTNLDVSKITTLKSLDCESNQITILDVSLNTDLSNLNCSSNLITNLDISKNAILTSLNCSSNQLSTIDVGKNAVLTSLDCGYNQLAFLDVSKNITLLYLYCHNNQLTALDISQNTALIGLLCNENQLTTLDTRNNTELISLWCSSNQLTNIDVNNNTIFYSLLCDKNRLNFSSLPINQVTTYIYSPQDSMVINKSINVGEELDLSSQLSVTGKTTTYKWKTKSGATLVLGSDYNLSNGRTVFIKPQAARVFCEMTNATFPNFSGTNTLKTTSISVLSLTSVCKNASPDIEIYVHNKSIVVDLSITAQIVVCNSNGKIILFSQSIKGNNIFEMPTNGIYLVRIATNIDIVTRKVIVQ